MKILTWNVRGALKPSFRSSFGRLLQLHAFDICVLLETRLSGDSLACLRRQLSRSWASYAVESAGLSGGILVLWRHDNIRVNAFHGCGQQIALVISEGSSTPWLLSGIYASTDFRMRRVLWAEILSLLDQGLPSLIAGDFNCIVGAEEKRGGRQFVGSPGVAEFRSFISSAELLDLGFTGSQHTWCNNRQGSARVWERLDRAMATSSWLQLFPSVTVAHLPRIGSDHCPILISTDHSSQQSRQFRFEKFWTFYSSARTTISQVWQLPVRGSATYRLSRRLIIARCRLSSWNKREVGDIVRQVEKVEATISSLQSKEDLEGLLLDSDLLILRSSLALHHSLMLQQETFWRQRSRIQWIKEGDRNTRFFHQATLKRRAMNRIRRIVDEEGDIQEDVQIIRDQFFQYFQSRWTEHSGVGFPVFPVQPPYRVTTADNARLIRSVMAEDIQCALWDLGPDKAPGPDGFPPFFFRHYWDIVGQDVVQAIQLIFQSHTIPTDWNRTLITLVPKRPDPSSPLHYRPISLCTTLYKVCARLLVSRLAPVIPRLISSEQGAFIRGRSITDNALLAQEFMHDLQRASSSQSLMAVKLDMERAYDRLSWDFLRYTLQEFGFDDLFIAWIMACIHRPSFSLLINGGQTDYFHSEVGLRQGCPLSPFLFILSADALSRALNQAQMDSSLAPYSAGPLGPTLSHLLFADDCILLGKASTCNASTLATILKDYCRASGQKVNLNKSLICFSPKTPPSVKGSILCIMGIPVQADRLSYLGIPITGRRPRNSDFSALVRRVSDRLDGWQVTGLSMMARITLLRSVLSSLPIYLLSNAAIPLTCLRKIERYFRDFLWASMQDGHGVHLLAWDIVCMPIEEGGLGIQSLTSRREALIARHASRFLLDPHCLWSSFMRAKYGDWNHSSFLQASRGQSFFWKEVCRHAPAVLDCTSWMIGDGTSVDVVQDAWIADLPLSRWPTFVCTDIPDGMRVCDLISQDHSAWVSSSVSSFFGGELYRRITSIPLVPGPTVDTRVWRRSCLSQASMRDLLNLYRPLTQQAMDLAWIWRLPIHPRVRLFIWKLARNVLPTCSLLSRRGMSIMPTCPVCGLEEETVDHAIFLCIRARQIWQSSGECPWEYDSDSQRLSFIGLFRQDSRRGYHQMVPRWAYTAYQIWLSRNQLVFTDETASPHRVVRSAASLSAEYTFHQRSLDSASPGHWVSHAASAAHRRTVFISWEPPPPGFVKINFDGSVRGRYAGSAFVIRGADGSMLAAGGFGLLDSSVPLAELYAAWAGISYALRSLGVYRLIIEGDSATVISWIRQEPTDHLPSIPLISDIRSLLQGTDSAQIQHIYREANSAADWIAARVAYHSGFWSWKQGDPCPIILTQILYSDISGSTHPRMV